MITNLSGSLEIEDLQRLLAKAGLLKLTPASNMGVWGVETQNAVLAAYSRLDWKHDPAGEWISAPALAALAGVGWPAGSDRPTTQAEGRTGGDDRRAGGGGNYAGGGGNYAGGGGDIT